MTIELTWHDEVYEALLDGLAEYCKAREPTGFADANGVEIRTGDLVQFYIDEHTRAMSATPVNGDDDVTRFVDVVVKLQGEFISVSIDACGSKSIAGIYPVCTIVGNVIDSPAPLRETSWALSGKLPEIFARPVIGAFAHWAKTWGKLNAEHKASELGLTRKLMMDFWHLPMSVRRSTMRSIGIEVGTGSMLSDFELYVKAFKEVNLQGKQAELVTAMHKAIGEHNRA